jgi:class 3 adenylate cyclase
VTDIPQIRYAKSGDVHIAYQTWEAGAIVTAPRAAGIPVRAGLHTGELVRRGDDVAGLAVQVGARVAPIAGESDVVVSSTVRDLVLGAEFRFADRGTHALKGVDGEWRLLSLVA